MNYKEKYNKLVEAVKVLQKTNSSDEGIQNWINDNVPELRKNDDEKIRKGIISGMKALQEKGKYTCFANIPMDDVFAWLEKQGKETSWKPSKEEMDVLYGLAYITNQYDEHKEEVITRLYQDLKREFFNGSSYENMFPNTEEDVRRKSTIQVLEYARSLDTYNQYGKADIDKNIAWLEKQGEKLPVGFYYVNSEGKKFYSDTFKYGDLTLHVEKQGGIDNCTLEGLTNTVMTDSKKNQVKPKFKVGDWITNGQLTCKVLSVIGKSYELHLYNDDYCHFETDIQSVDKDYHLWTIQDAKDGDVIIDKSGSRECSFIFKETKPSDIKTDMLNPLTVLGYCGIGGAGFTKESGWGDTVNCIYYPATKEQRDTLEKAMTDAGYTFDFEKKELKLLITNGGDFFESENCEQNHDWSEEEIEKAAQEWDSKANLNPFYMTPTGVKQDITTHEESFKAGVNWILKSLKGRVQLKQEWNEEDEKHLKLAIDNFQTLGNSFLTSWLKSLKDRIQLKQEWSGEDENRINHLIAYFEDKEGFTAEDDIAYANWLKSLKDRIQPKQEWNEEDEKTLNEIFSVAARASLRKSTLFGKSYDYIKWQNWLKSLKNRVQPQPKWSEEDNKIIEEIINDIECARAINYHAPKEGYEFKENWLKSLKDRVQPKQEWSEEDEERIKNILSVLDIQVCWDGATGKKGNPYQKEISWLKSFKERVQPKKEWSEKDKCMLNNVIDALKPLSQTTHSSYAINSMINWLNSLRPQNTWKPSDEQINAFEHFVKSIGESGYASPYDNNTKL